MLRRTGALLPTAAHSERERPDGLPRARDGSALPRVGIVVRIDEELTIEERLARLEQEERVVWELRRSQHARMEGIRRGRAGFDIAAREQLAELRRRERALESERMAVQELVEEATNAVLTRRRAREQTTAYEPA